MIWTATKKAVVFEKGTVVQTVVFTDGVEGFNIDYRSNAPPADWPDADIRNRLETINSIDLSKLKPGSPNPPPEKPANPVPTQAEIDKAKFFTDYRKERTANLLKTLSPELQSRYLPEYGQLF